MSPIEDPPRIEQVRCPGCCAPLPVRDVQAIVTCGYCGVTAKVALSLRKIEPPLAIEPPVARGDPSKEYEQWTAEQLVRGILDSTDADARISMAKALDDWAHVSPEAARWVPAIIAIMEKAEPRLDTALAGILGKLVCSDDRALRQAVIAAGERSGFNRNGSKGLLFALSLGDAGTVKLLLDIAEWAARNGAPEYADHALMSVQTAIGREAKQYDVCVEILLYRFLHLSGIVQQWIAGFLRNHFDVGYRTLYSHVVELIDDCGARVPHAVAPLADALMKCRPAETRGELRERLSVHGFIRGDAARIAACKSLGPPPQDVRPEDVRLAVEVLLPFIAIDGSPGVARKDESLAGAADEALAGFAWAGDGLPPPLMELHERYGERLPKHLRHHIGLRLR